MNFESVDIFDLNVYVCAYAFFMFHTHPASFQFIYDFFSLLLLFFIYPSIIIIIIIIVLVSIFRQFVLYDCQSRFACSCSYTFIVSLKSTYRRALYTPNSLQFIGLYILCSVCFGSCCIKCPIAIGPNEYFTMQYSRYTYYIHIHIYMFCLLFQE